MIVFKYHVNSKPSLPFGRTLASSDVIDDEVDLSHLYDDSHRDLIKLPIHPSVLLFMSMGKSTPIKLVVPLEQQSKQLIPAQYSYANFQQTFFAIAQQNKEDSEFVFVENDAVSDAENQPVASTSCRIM